MSEEVCEGVSKTRELFYIYVCVCVLVMSVLVIVLK